MTTREDIIERMHLCHSLPRGPERSALRAEAVTWAEDIGAEDLSVALHAQLVNDYFWGQEEWKGLAPFVWCLERQRERPDLFDERIESYLRHCYKIAISVASRNPAVPVEQVRALEAAMETYYREQGASMHTVHGQRYYVARNLGLPEEAVAELAAWRATPRDDSSDCAACDPEHQITQAIADGDWELALATAVPILNEEIGCDEQPARVRSNMLEAFLATGRTKAAWDAHVRSYRKHRTNVRHAGTLEEHLGYLALSGHMDRGLTILRRHAPWTARCGSATSLLSMLIGATVLLRQAVRAGRGGEPLGVELPESRLWCPGFNVPADFTLAQAAEACEAWARHLSELYDRRNGNTFFTEQLQKALAREPYLTDPGSGPRVELLEAPEALPEAVPYSDLPQEQGAGDGTGGRGEPAPDAPPVPDTPAAPTGDLPAEPYPPVDIPHLDPPAGLDEALRESFPRERMLSRVDRELLDQYFKTSGLLTRPAPPELAVEAALVQAAFATREGRHAEALELRCRARNLLAARHDERSPRERDLNLWRIDTMCVRDEALCARASEQEEDQEAREDRRRRLDGLTEAVLGAVAQFLDDPRASAAEAFAAVRALISLGEALIREGLDLRIKEVEEVYDAATGVVDLLERRGIDPEHVAVARHHVRMARTYLLVIRGDIYRACNLADSAMRAAERTPLETALDSRSLIAGVSMQYEQYEEAIAQWQEVVNLALAAGLEVTSVNTLDHLARALGAASRPLEAAEVLETALDLAAGTGHEHLSLDLRRTLVLVLTDLEEDEGIREQSVRCAEELLARGDTQSAAGYLERAAGAGARMERSDDAASLFLRCADLEPTGPQADDGARFRRSRLLRRAARTLATRPSPAASRLHLERALDLIEQSRRLARSIPASEHYSAVWEDGAVDSDMSDIYWRCDEYDLAVEASERAVTSYLSEDDRATAAQELSFIARLHAERLDQPGQREAAQKAIARGRGLLAHPRWQEHEAMKNLARIEEYLEAHPSEAD